MSHGTCRRHPINSGEFQDSSGYGTHCGRVELTWDHRNRLTKATFKDDQGTLTKIVEYAYDHGQRWVRKTLDTNADQTIEESRMFVHDDGQIVLDFQKTGTAAAGNSDLAHRYLWGNSVDQLLADETVDDGSEDDAAWALTDHLNSVRDLVVYNPVTGTVSVVKHVTFDAFGNVTSDNATGVSSLFLYTARPFDPDTDLQNNLNRWYDLSTGRWMSVDPIGFAAGDANLYRYVGNSAINWIDPNGLQIIQPLPPIDAPPWNPNFQPLPPINPGGDCEISIRFQMPRQLSTGAIRLGKLSGTATVSQGLTVYKKEVCECCCPGETGIKSKWEYSTSFSVSVSLARSWGIVYDAVYQDSLPAKLFQVGVLATVSATASVTVDLGGEFSICPGADPPVNLRADFTGRALLDARVTAISQTLLWSARADVFGEAVLSMETSLQYTSHGDVGAPATTYSLDSAWWGYRLMWEFLGEEVATGGVRRSLI